MLTTKQKRELMKNPEIRKLKQVYDRKHRGMKGSGFWEDLGKRIGKNAAKLNKWAKDTKAISKTGKAVAAASPLLALNPATIGAAVPAGVIGTAISGIAGAYGYGKGCMCGGSASASLSTPSRLGMKGKGSSTPYGTVYPLRPLKVRF